MVSVRAAQYPLAGAVGSNPRVAVANAGEAGGVCNVAGDPVAGVGALQEQRVELAGYRRGIWLLTGPLIDTVAVVGLRIVCPVLLVDRFSPV